MQPLSIFRTILLFSVLVITIGCASYPEVRYHEASKDFNPTDKKNLMAFSLQGALVTVSPKPKPEQAAAQGEKPNQPKTQLKALGLEEKKGFIGIKDLEDTQVLATQADAKDSLYFLESKDNFLTKSNISVSYFDGSHRIKVIGTEFQDDRIKIIQAIGGTIIALLPLVALAPPPPPQAEEKLELPLVFDFTDPAMFKDTDWANIPNYKTWWYKYKISQPKGRIFPTKEFFENHKNYTREFPVSACVDLTLDIGKGQPSTQADAKTGTAAVPAQKPKGGDKVMSYTVRIPHPSYVEPLPFPLKGNITVHPVCGADMSTQPSQASSTFEILEETAKQVEAIWQAQQKKAK